MTSSKIEGWEKTFFHLILWGKLIEYFLGECYCKFFFMALLIFLKKKMLNPQIALGHFLLFTPDVNFIHQNDVFEFESK